RPRPRPTLFPYTTLFRSVGELHADEDGVERDDEAAAGPPAALRGGEQGKLHGGHPDEPGEVEGQEPCERAQAYCEGRDHDRADQVDRVAVQRLADESRSAAGKAEADRGERVREAR